MGVASGARTLVALNLSERDAVVDGVTGVVRLSTVHARAGEHAPEMLPLAAWEGAIVEVESLTG